MSAVAAIHCDAKEQLIFASASITRTLRNRTAPPPSITATATTPTAKKRECRQATFADGASAQ